MKLRTQVFFVLILPVVLSLTLAGGLVAVYLSFYYADSIQTTSDDMKTQQADVLAQVSNLISRLGSSALQGKINSMLLSSQLMRLQAESDLKQEWNEAGNAVGGVLFSRWTKGEATIGPVPGLNHATGRSYSFAMWLIGSRNITLESLNVTTRAHMRWAASFDYFSQAAVRLSTSNQVYFAFESDGFFYLFPVQYWNALYNATEAGFLASKCPRAMGEDKYDPRCRPFYKEVVANGPTNRVTLATPYLFSEKDTIGQTVCAPIWSESTLISMHCLDFDLLELRKWMQTVKIGSAGYSYLVSRKGLPFIHPKLNEYWTSDPPDLLQLEFSRDIYYQNVEALRAEYEANSRNMSIKAEIEYFNSSVMPQLKTGNRTITSYSRLGETYIAGLTPLTLRFSMQDSSNYLSVAVVMEITKFIALYNTLVTSGEDLVNKVAIVLAVLLFVISVLGMVLAAWLSHFVLGTLRTIIQHINAILARDFRRYIEIPDYIPDEVKVMYDLLRFMKHITQYNSSKDPELHELIAVIKDLDDFKEVREFLTCCRRIALKCIKMQNYTESVKICMLFACILPNKKEKKSKKKIDVLKSDPKAIVELINLLDLLAQSLLETRQSLEQTEIDKIIKALSKLRKELQDNRLETRLTYLTWVLRSPNEQEMEKASFIDEFQVKYIKDLQESKQKRKNEAMELYRRVVFGTEYSTLMKGKTIENVISLAIHIVEKLAPKDMFGFLSYTDRANVSLPSGSLDHKLAYIRALEQFNQPKGDSDFYAGLIGGLKELAKERQHATAHLHFIYNQHIESEFLVLVTTGQLLDASRETEALQTLYQYKGELIVVWLRAKKERCEEGFRRIQGALEQWSLEGGILTIIEARDSEEVMTNPQVYQQLGLSTS